MTRPATIAAALLLVLLAAGPTRALDLVVPGTSNPYLAGMPNGSTCCFGDSAPAQSPVVIAVAPGTVLTFSASGAVSFGPADTTPDGPDGGEFFTSQQPPFFPGTDSSNGIARMNSPANALVGVFLDDTRPDSSPVPPGLDFSPTGLGRSFSQLAPGLKQPFFIGDGLTGTGTGAQQQFIVPGGATRLFLGTTDGIGWANNTGAFSVQVNIAGPPLSAQASVNQASYVLGDTLVETVGLTNFGGVGTADIYLGLLGPDGHTILFFANGGTVTGDLSNFGSFQPLVAGVPLSTPFSVTVPSFSTHQWTAGDAHGSYVFFMLVLQSGALANASVDNGELLAVAATGFTYP